MGEGESLVGKWVTSIQIKMKCRVIMILTRPNDQVLIGYTGRLVEWLVGGKRGSKDTVFVLLKLTVDC